VPGVYISYPFCAQKCTYCNFASGVFPQSLESEYMAALRREIAAHRWQWTPDTLYIGGGTPSALDPAELESILELLPGKPWAEATIEAAPGTVTPEKAESWRRAGFTRVSLGAQSFVRQELARTGRRHTAETVEADVATLRRAGMENLNLDLIAGLAGQTAASWEESLDWIEKLDPPHVSIYLLEIDEDSRLGAEILLGGTRYGANERPPDDLAAELYETAAARLRGLGVERYEISNFARPGWESRHNLKYWNLAPYAGFGADAHGFDGVTRRSNLESPAEYAAALSPLAGSTAASSDERFFVGLRLARGIEPDAGEWRRYERPIRKYVGEGLLEIHERTLRLTSRGVLLSNEVLQEFLA
jgi:oxygen-independent coproporphyrinogen III oxidase